MFKAARKVLLPPIQVYATLTQREERKEKMRNLAALTSFARLLLLEYGHFSVIYLNNLWLQVSLRLRQCERSN